MRWEKLRQEIAESLLEKNSEEMPALFVALKSIEEIIVVNYPDYFINVEKIRDVDKDTFIGMISDKRDEALNTEELFIVDEIYGRMQNLDKKSVAENFHQTNCPNCGKSILIHQSELSSRYVYHSTCDTKVQNPLYSEKSEKTLISFIVATIVIFLSIAIVTVVSTNQDGPRNEKALQSNIQKYLNERLHDSESYRPVEWYAPKILSDGCYIVHKYRAKNLFGGYRLSFTVFKLDRKGNVVWSEELEEDEIDSYIN